ncbi:MAG TPA: heme-binding beta-barrel domain-containing protein [Acidimicrobiales bacterium]|nr:heme-binding beta-barrel domain-containing protein [Acidimicrobiales bacterium]
MAKGDDIGMHDYGTDIFTEADGSDETLAHLGPLAPMAGTWEGHKGVDEHPVREGTETDAFVEHYELVPIDRQTNGPQLYYGLRYHTHITKPGEVETFHDQVGYWLWEPATGMVIQTIAIPRAQVAMACGRTTADATEFELDATLGSEEFGILSNPFLTRAFTTLNFHLRVTINPDGTWSYEEVTLLQLPDRTEPFRHVDHNTLRRVLAPPPNPLAAPGATP